MPFITLSRSAAPNDARSHADAPPTKPPTHLQNASSTALDRLVSMVKASRLQSTLEPMCRIWLVILLPYVSFHSHTLDTNASRPRSCLQQHTERDRA